MGRYLTFTANTVDQVFLPKNIDRWGLIVYASLNASFWIMPGTPAVVHGSAAVYPMTNPQSFFVDREGVSVRDEWHVLTFQGNAAFPFLEIVGSEY